MKCPALDPVLEKAAGESADAVRARHGFARLLEGCQLVAPKPAARTTSRSARRQGAGVAGDGLLIDAQQARILAALFSGSQALGELLLKHPDWAGTLLAPASLAHPRKEQGLRREMAAILEPALSSKDYAGALSQLRVFKQREMMRIAARDLARLDNAHEVIREISDVADVCLAAVLRVCRQQLSERFGQPWHADPDGAWQPTQFCVLGLGKLGGQELNYSSDVDVIFVYSEEGSVFKERPRAKATAHGLTNHQFFKRLAESFIAEVTRATPEGTLFRIDLRLRPEGDAGPLVRSLPSYETFYAQWGQTWERMMLIKARCVAGDATLAGEFLETVHSFRYPRSLGPGTLREIAATKARLENEGVRAGELDVKRGRGGIREIEFIVQTIQLLKAGRLPFLQGAQTMAALQQMVRYQLVTPAEARDLSAAYAFLRDVEHRLQMENNLQTHTVPTARPARERLARLMGFPRTAAFDAALGQQLERVRKIYEKYVGVDPEPAVSPLPARFANAEVEWKQWLARHGFKEVDKSFRLLREFAEGPGYIHISTRTTELALQLVPRLFALCKADGAGQPAGGLATGGSPLPTHHADPLSDPDRVLARLDSFISAYGARAVLFEAWAANPQIFELLVLLFDRSEFLAEIAIRTPDLVDDLVMSGHLRRSKDAEEILEELRHGNDDADQRLWLRKYHQAEFMRIGLRSILGLADYELNFVELTALADACLQYALESVLREQKFKAAPLVIVGLGKLGGFELNYGSDLDIVFVADDKAKRSLPKLQKVAAAVMDLLSSPTELGIAFLTDARLRPDGEKGLLVNTLGAYEEYYRHRAQLWEIQALTRARPIAGDQGLGGKFQQMAARLTDFRPTGKGAEAKLPDCYTPGWKQEIARMRSRIEVERTPAGQDALAFKTGSGGLIDAEFIAQAWCLEQGWQEPSTLRALERGRAARLLPEAEMDSLLAGYRQLRRLENILRRWSFEGETVLPDDAAAYRRVSIRCGFATPDAFRTALAEWRRAIRMAYTASLGTSPR